MLSTQKEDFVVFLNWGPAALSSSFPSPPTVTSEAEVIDA